MTLRTVTSEKAYMTNNRVGRTYMTFSERYNKSNKSNKRKKLHVIFVDINVNNEFGVCFEI